MYSNELNLAKNIAANVGDMLKKRRSEVRIEAEEDKDIKINLDKIAENSIMQQLVSRFNYPILSEETGRIGIIKNDSIFWIIDPLDGTLNYSRGISLSCISIALFKGNVPLVGVIYDFNNDEMFSGVCGVGSWLNDKPLIRPRKRPIGQSVLATGFSIYGVQSEIQFYRLAELSKKFKKIRLLGSAALSLAYVACGRVDAYSEEYIKIWDIAAGLAINRALGIETDLKFLDDDLINISIGVHL